MVRVAIAFVWLMVLSAVAQAEKRVALVIGNGAYTKVLKLENPKNDATAIEAMLRAAGFNAVVRVNDAGVAAMKRALRDFSDTARDADIGVVFYAGHGIEVSGVNYLIPTDAVLERDVDVQDEAVSLDRVNQALEQVKHLRLVILDACRDNPFVRSMRRTLATRTVRSGYGEIDERSLPPNTLVAYAQRAGATADDGAGSNSPYTTALLKHLPTPGLDVELALRRVRDEVLRSTKNRQEPFKYGSLGGTEIAIVAAKVAPAVAPALTGTPQSNDEVAALKQQLAKLESELKRQRETGAANAEEAALKDTLAKRKSELKRREDEQWKKVAIAPTPPAPDPRASNVAPKGFVPVPVAPKADRDIGTSPKDDSRPSGTLIAYAAAPGGQAMDGDGRASPFTKALLTHIATANLSITDVMGRASADVARDTNNKQSSWYVSRLTAPFYLARAPSSWGSWAIFDQGRAPTERTEKRVALVIGNANYGGVQPLANPVNDAMEMEKVLRTLGFRVLLLTDARKTDLDEAIRRFGGLLAAADVGLFYYSGHGFQTSRADQHHPVNHIVPVDFRVPTGVVLQGTVPLDDVLVSLERARVSLVFMDACRSDPQLESSARRLGQGSR